MKEVTAEGRTVEEAIADALTQLNVTEDQADVTIIDEGKKGFLGIGSKRAIVKVTKLPNHVEEAKLFLQNVIRKMGIEASIEEREQDDAILFELTSENIAILIGKRGQTLNALEHLTNLIANRSTKQYVRIQLDAENYRKRRKEALTQLAKRQADRAIKLNRKIVLEPMPAQERKIIHITLKDVQGITTNSSGEGLNRHIVIIPSP